MTNVTLQQHLDANAGGPPVVPTIPPPPAATTPEVPADVLTLLTGPLEVDRAGILAHYGYPAGMTPDQVDAVIQHLTAPLLPTPEVATPPVPAPTPTVVPSSGKLAPPRPSELKAAETATEPEKPGRKPRSDKGKARASGKSKGSTTDELLLACASGGLTAEQAGEYLALRDEMGG